MAWELLIVNGGLRTVWWGGGVAYDYVRGAWRRRVRTGKWRILAVYGAMPGGVMATIGLLTWC